MHPRDQLSDSVDLTWNEELKMSTKLDSGYEQERSSQVPLPPRRKADILTSSTSSLKPPLDGRRKLLLIYIHGFMGAEDSFRQFPAHVHNLVTNVVAESHVVYSKIYPRYKSRRAMSLARDEFSEWITPHESSQTDVILLGHSLGGILAAEVVLAQDEHENSLSRNKHCILGTINFDVPFLGMHPSVVGTGLAALFHPKRKDESPPGDESKTTDTENTRSCTDSDLPNSVDSTASWFERTPDSNFDPPFPNDVHRVKRSQLDGAFHFMKKNSGSLTTAVMEYANSYLEFGGCLADYSGLRRRYALLKDMEAINDIEPKPDKQGQLQRRLRFVNYYTASPGFPKKSPSDLDGQKKMERSHLNVMAATTESLENLTKLPSPTISVESFDSFDDGLAEVEPKPVEEYHVTAELSSLDLSSEELPEQPCVDEEAAEANDKYTGALKYLPPLPGIPARPAPLDLSLYEDKEILKQAQKEHGRLMKLHERGRKEHEETLKEREKLVRKLNKRKQKSASSVTTESETKNYLDDHNEETSPPMSEQKNTFLSTDRLQKDKSESMLSISPSPSSASLSAKAPKDRVFCALPGSSDRLWVRIFMPDIDQVVAHQSIFKPNGLYYEWLVNDTAARIEQWVQDDTTRRVIWEQFGGNQ